MKEKFEKLCNSFKSGVMFWIIAYMLLYAIGEKIGDQSLYYAQVMKLTNIGNFLAQVFIAGTSYLILEVVLVHLANKTIETFETEEKPKKKIVKYAFVALLLITILLVAQYEIKERDIMNKTVLKLMISLVAIKAAIFIVAQAVNTCRYNRKLHEKNKEE